MPVYGQSENRSSTAAPLAAQLTAAAPGRVYSLFGMVDTNGKEVGPDGAGWTGDRLNTIDQTVPATGFAGTVGYSRVSPAFSMQFFRAMDMAPDAGAVIADHGYGGRYIREWRLDDASPLGRNQAYWLREAKRVADGFGVSTSCPYVFLWQGMSAKSQNVPVYRTDFDVAHGELLAEVLDLFGTVPKLVIVGNGADSDTSANDYIAYMPDTVYRIAQDYGGIIATWQRLFPTMDGNGHPEPAVKVLVGETAALATREVEAGNPWTITYSVAKSGATVTVTFGLRPGETLLDRPTLFDNYGGAATCQNFGFEADGGIISAAPDFGGNTVTITLANANAAWFRFAKQLQNTLGEAFRDSAGLYMSAHRSTLFGSHSWASDLIPGAVIWRPLPSFGGTFSGNAFAPIA